MTNKNLFWFFMGFILGSFIAGMSTYIVYIT